MPHSKSTVVPFIAPETFRRLEKRSAYELPCRGDSACRCTSCKPTPIYQQDQPDPTRVVEYALIAALIAVGAFLSVVAYHG